MVWRIKNCQLRLSAEAIIIMHLELSNNGIGSEGARVVLDDLNCRHDIEVLDLGLNGIEGAVWGGLK